MSLLRKFVGVVILGLVVLGVLLALAGNARPREPVIGHAGPTLEQIQALAALVTTRVTVTDTLTPQITGWTGGMAAVIVVRGDALLAVDLQQARITRSDAATRSFTLSLPEPQVLEARVDHDHSRIFAVQRQGFWRLMRLDALTRELLDQGMREAQQTIARAAGDPTLLARVREHAAQVLSTFAHSTGWQLSIQWGVPAEGK